MTGGRQEEEERIVLRLNAATYEEEWWREWRDGGGGWGGTKKEDGGIVKMQWSGRAPFHAAAGARGSCVNAGVQSGKSLKSPATWKHSATLDGFQINSSIPLQAQTSSQSPSPPPVLQWSSQTKRGAEKAPHQQESDAYV